jgi:hypothetical protein
MSIRIGSTATDNAMSQSRLFMSSLSRRQLARRRPGRGPGWSVRALILVLIVVVICVAAFVIGHGGI